MATGKVSFYNIQDRYGFIVPDNGGEYVFFSQKQIMGFDNRPLS